MKTKILIIDGKSSLDEIMKRYEPLRKANIAEVSNLELSQLFNDYLNVNRRQWEIHFYWLYAVCCLRAFFENTLTELTGVKADAPLAGDLLGGFDNMLFAVNKEIWKLGNSAKNLGLGDLFVNTTDDKELYSKLNEREVGKKWLAEHDSFLQEYGWRNPRMMEWCNPSWIEDPSLGMRDIRNSIASEESFTLDEKRKLLEEKRKKAEQEILAEIPEDQRSWFKKLLDVSLTCVSWSEEHNIYLDLFTNCLGRKVTWEIGKRFAKAGVIDDPNDLYMLMPWEIRKAIVTMERINLRPYAEARRKEWEENCKKPPVPLIGDMEALGDIVTKDPVIGIEASPPKVNEEFKADLYGAGAAPGVVEGTARVIMDEGRLHEIQKGEILVTPTTGAPWTPIFGLISGIVTDHGGCLAHAAIVAREYGIPAVVGTHEATKKIKTGMKIKLDGNNNAVWILE